MDELLVHTTARSAGYAFDRARGLPRVRFLAATYETPENLRYDWRPYALHWGDPTAIAKPPACGALLTSCIDGISWWRMDEIGPLALDATSTRGDFEGEKPQVVEGLSGLARRFEKVDDTMSAEDQDAFDLTEFTIELAVRRDAIEPSGTLLSKTPATGGYRLGFLEWSAPFASLKYETDGQGQTATATIPSATDDWQLLVARLSGGGLTLARDYGAGSPIPASAPVATLGPLVLGLDPVDTEPLLATIDSVRVFSKAKTADELLHFPRASWTVGAIDGAPDSDLDGVPDDVDSCPETPNSDQADPDGDGLGSPCDMTPCGGCDDGDPCTTHWCDATNGCQFVATTAATCAETSCEVNLCGLTGCSTAKAKYFDSGFGVAAVKEVEAVIERYDGHFLAVGHTGAGEGWILDVDATGALKAEQTVPGTSVVLYDVAERHDLTTLYVGEEAVETGKALLVGEQAPGDAIVWKTHPATLTSGRAILVGHFGSTVVAGVTEATTLEATTAVLDGSAVQQPKTLGEPGGDNALYAMVRIPGGYMAVGNRTLTETGAGHAVAWRLDTQRTFETTIDLTEGTSSVLRDLVLMPDGRLVMVGEAVIAGSTRAYVVYALPDGTPIGDPWVFAGDDGFAETFESVARLGDDVVTSGRWIPADQGLIATRARHLKLQNLQQPWWSIQKGEDAGLPVILGLEDSAVMAFSNGDSVYGPAVMLRLSMEGDTQCEQP